MFSIISGLDTSSDNEASILTCVKANFSRISTGVVLWLTPTKIKFGPEIIYQICKKKSIPILLLNISKFSNMCYISQSIHRLDQEPDPNDDQNFSFEDLQKLLTSNNLSQPLERIHSKTIQQDETTKLKNLITIQRDKSTK